jgi:Zn finger protein HypA/HybF involved in hydrogenase expression
MCRFEMRLTDTELKEIVAISLGYSDLMRKMGYNTKGGGTQRILKKRILDLQIDISHFKGKAHGTSNTAKQSLSEILVVNSTYINLASLKRRLLKNNLIEYKCKICEIVEWQNMKLSLQLDHINGINNDNRLENLRLLCPNCHSQTSTFAGKNNK